MCISRSSLDWIAKSLWGDSFGATLRDEVKAAERDARASGDDNRAAQFAAEQKALKDLANSTAYGIFLELIVRNYDRLQQVQVYSGDDKPFTSRVHNVEEPGAYFDPLLGTLITGAGRLLLMLAELRAETEGVGWMFCDTDSMALSRPTGMRSDEFLRRAKRVQAWFDPLNPYTKPQPLFKVEDQNYALDQLGQPTAQLARLNGFAVSAKRNVLFNMDAENGRLVPRKVSAHGLGHLRAPYDADHAPASVPAPAVPLHQLEVERWQYDLWYRISVAALGTLPDQVDLQDLPGFDEPAATRYAATTPSLLDWYRGFNEGRPYEQQVKPFGFLLAFQGKVKPEQDIAEPPQIVAPFDSDIRRAASRAFDRVSGRRVGRSELKTYREAVAQYHLHPEAKFLRGDYGDTGVTVRRHVTAAIVTCIGKEANEWERQLHLGSDASAAIMYGPDPRRLMQMRSRARKRIHGHGVRAVARATGLSIGELSMLKGGSRTASAVLAARIIRAQM